MKIINDGKETNVGIDVVEMAISISMNQKIAKRILITIVVMGFIYGIALLAAAALEKPAITSITLSYAVKPITIWLVLDIFFLKAIRQPQLLKKTMEYLKHNAI
ncbi:MAG: hypothetical protein VYA60_07960 [Pseudomonadota bacterium]|nr:hypothetical protein [Pseudomonadota bacterium]